MTKKTIFLLGIIILLFSSGCTKRTITPIDSSTELDYVCIEENPKVIVPGFLTILGNGFHRHDIDTRVYSDETPRECEYIVTYTALRAWDLTPYLSHAEICMRRNGKQIAYGQYHLIGDGGLSLTKWAGVKSKMDPVIDEMLADYNPNAAQPAKAEDLERLNNLYESGVIPEEEYKTMKARLENQSGGE